MKPLSWHRGISSRESQPRKSGQATPTRTNQTRKQSFNGASDWGRRCGTAVRAARTQNRYEMKWGWLRWTQNKPITQYPHPHESFPWKISNHATCNISLMTHIPPPRRSIRTIPIHSEKGSPNKTGDDAQTWSPRCAKPTLCHSNDSPVFRNKQQTPDAGSMDTPNTLLTGH